MAAEAGRNPPPPGEFLPAQAKNRFDVPGQRMLYAAESFACAVGETLIRPRATTPARVEPPPFVERGELPLRAAAQLLPPRILTQLDLTGPGLRALGLDAGVFALRDYAHTQEIAADLLSRYLVDGFLWRSRLNPEEFAQVLFESRLGAPPRVLQSLPLDHPAVLPELERVLGSKGCALRATAGLPAPDGSEDG